MSASRSAILLVGLQGVLVGLDRETGQIVWKNKLQGGGLGTVYVVTLGRRLLVSSSGAYLYCIDYQTGATVWTAETTTSGRATIVVQDEQIFVAKGGYLDCFSLEGGRLWKQELKGLGLGNALLGFPGNLAQADDVGGH